MNQDISIKRARSHGQAWNLVCGPGMGTPSVPINLAELRLIENLGRQLNLEVQRDDKTRSLYIWAHQQNTLKFEEGWMVETVSDEEAGAEYECVDPETAAPLISAYPDQQLSRHFRLREFRPGDGQFSYMRVCPRLVRALEEIRSEAGGQPLSIVSGYRPPAFNRQLGGISNSTHLDGIAADIRADHLSVSALYDICEGVIGQRGGVGYYPHQGYVHVDLRGYEARW